MARSRLISSINRTHRRSVSDPGSAECRAISKSIWRMVSGVRSSWAASALKRLAWWKLFSNRSSMALKTVMSRMNSRSCAVATMRWSSPRAVMPSTLRVRSETGCNARDDSHQAPLPTNASNIGRAVRKVFRRRVMPWFRLSRSAPRARVR